MAPRIKVQILEPNVFSLGDRREVQRPVDLPRRRINLHHDVVSRDVRPVGVERRRTIRDGGDLVGVLVPRHAANVVLIVEADVREGQDIDHLRLVRVVHGDRGIEQRAAGKIDILSVLGGSFCTLGTATTEAYLVYSRQRFVSKSAFSGYSW